MPRILLSHKGISQDDLKARAELHVFKMDGNPNYVAFQPLITTFKPLVDTYATALINAKLGGSDRIKAKNKAKEALENFITKMAKTLELAANDLPEDEAEEFVKGAGFDMPEARSSSKPQTFLETPVLTIEKVKGRSGALIMDWNRIAGAITYAFEELDSDGNWQNGKYCNQPTLLLTDLAVGSKKTYRMKAVGMGTLVSAPSEPVTVWVN